MGGERAAHMTQRNVLVVDQHKLVIRGDMWSSSRRRRRRTIEIGALTFCLNREAALRASLKRIENELSLLFYLSARGGGGCVIISQMRMSDVAYYVCCGIWSMKRSDRERNDVE